MRQSIKSLILSLIVAFCVIADAGIIRTGIARGRVTAIASVTVNGVKFDTDAAVIILDGVPGTLSDIRVGQVLEVQGGLDDEEPIGIADIVIFDDNVEGSIESIDFANSELVVLGQTVALNEGTRFGAAIDPQSLSGLQPGNVVEISGGVNAGGEMVASWVDLKPAGGEFNVNGEVSGLSAGVSRFRINALTVDFATAMLLYFPTGAVQNGDTVEVKGTSFNAAGDFVATSIEFKTTALAAVEGDVAEVEGFITEFVSASNFGVEGQAVKTVVQTVIDNGSAADLFLDADVEVEGILDANGVLVADRIDIRTAANIKIAADVEAVNESAESLTVLGITTGTDELTRFDDESEARLEPFDIGDIDVGDYVEIRAAEKPPGSGTVTATRVRRDDPEEEVELQGFVESVGPSSVTVLGVLLQADDDTQFENVDDEPMSADDFFAAVRVGSLVKAEGSVDGARVMAQELEFELPATGRETP